MQTDFKKEELQEVSMDNFYQVMVKSIIIYYACHKPQIISLLNFLLIY